MHQIVMIDEEPANVLVYDTVLRCLPDIALNGFRSAAEALVWCAAHPFDLLLVNCEAMGPDVPATIAAFRSLPTAFRLPIVMITGTSNRVLRLRALEFGVDDFLNDPPDPAEVIVRTRTLLALRARDLSLAERDRGHALEVARLSEDLSAREQEAIIRLASAAEFRDGEIGNHIIRVGHYASLIACALGQPAWECELLLRATPLHDIGKVCVPDSILLKDGSLTELEWERVKAHAVTGYRLLRNGKSPLLQCGAEIALTHHERFDGSGYPHGTRGQAIPLSGRLCALSDVFDTLLSSRSYKKAWPIDEVLAYILAQSGKQFDPRVVDAFLDALPHVEAIRRRYADNVEIT